MTTRFGSSSADRFSYHHPNLNPHKTLGREYWDYWDYPTTIFRQKFGSPLDESKIFTSRFPSSILTNGHPFSNNTITREFMSRETSSSSSTTKTVTGPDGKTTTYSTSSAGIPTEIKSSTGGVGLGTSGGVTGSGPSGTSSRFTENFRNEMKNGSGISAVKNDPTSFQVFLDVSQFRPDEVDVKTVGNDVIIHAKHDEIPDDHGFVSREFTRRYQLPLGADPESVTCLYDSSGILLIKAVKDDPDTETSGQQKRETLIRIERPKSTTPTPGMTSSSSYGGTSFSKPLQQSHLPHQNGFHQQQQRPSSSAAGSYNNGYTSSSPTGAIPKYSKPGYIMSNGVPTTGAGIIKTSRTTDTHQTTSSTTAKLSDLVSTDV